MRLYAAQMGWLTPKEGRIGYIHMSGEGDFLFISKGFISSNDGIGVIGMCEWDRCVCVFECVFIGGKQSEGSKDRVGEGGNLNGSSNI